MREISLQLAQPFAFLLRTCAILYTQRRSVPLHNWPLLIPQRNGSMEEPAIFPVASPSNSSLILEWLARGQRNSPLLRVFGNVGGVDRLFPAIASSVIRG